MDGWPQRQSNRGRRGGGAEFSQRCDGVGVPRAMCSWSAPVLFPATPPGQAQHSLRGPRWGVRSPAGRGRQAWALGEGAVTGKYTRWTCSL